MNIDDEINFVVSLLNDSKYDQQYFEYVFVAEVNTRVEYFIIKLILLTNDYPIIEEYLERLLTKIPANDLKFATQYTPILHRMTYHLSHVSLKAFEIIIKKNICDINYLTENRNTPLHLLFNFEDHFEKVHNVVKLFILNGADLTIENKYGETVLDCFCRNCYVYPLSAKPIITTLIDAGANNKVFSKKSQVLEFIESYKCQNIKPAKR